MVPNLPKNGASFTGAGAYYLHDKPYTSAAGDTVHPRTQNRVAFTLSRNLANDDPDKALIEMWRTADAQALIKKAAGVEARGRKCTDPVKTVSLAWHPDDAPTRQDMIAAADEFLADMGWHEHQALLVAHNDTAHAHIHIILNRVHPETGRTLDDSYDQPRAQNWAARYERSHPQFRACPRNGGPKNDGPRPKSRQGIPNTLEKEGRELEQPFIEASQLLERLDGSERDLLHTLQTQEREAFFKTARQDFRAARQNAFRAVGEDFRPRWREHFNDAKMIRAQARELAGENATAAFKLARDGRLGDAWGVLKGQDTPRGFDPVAYAEAHIEAKAKALAEEQAQLRKERQETAVQQAYNDRNTHYLAIKERQKQERGELKSMAEAHSRGENVDLDRLRQLLTGDRRSPTEPNTLMRDLKRANDNAGPLAGEAAANDNRDPTRALKTARIRADAEHMARLMASVQMTNSPGMAATQTRALKDLTRRTQRELETRGRSHTGETTDRLQRRNEPTLNPKTLDSEQHDRQSRGRGRGRGGGSDP